MVGKHVRTQVQVEGHPRSKGAGPESCEHCIPFPVPRVKQKESGYASDAREYLRSRLAMPVSEIAQLLGISSAAVRLMIARGDLPGRKVGGGSERVTYIIPTAALIAWLDGARRALPEEKVA